MEGRLTGMPHVNELLSFVQSQQGRLHEARGELVATEDALLRLKGEIER